MKQAAFWNLLLGLLLLVLPGCTTAPPMATSTPVSLATPTTESVDPSPAIATETAEPTATATPAPLSQSGPWLLQQAWGQHEKPSTAVISNIDGTASQPLELPLDRWGFLPSLEVAPHGGRIAMVVRGEALDHHLWLMQFPGPEINKLPLLSPELRAEAQAETLLPGG
ncbi:MAG: hypothetical protein H0T73_05860 [Ardenticatenales bacterium]|nr:hypothetical protein [Ardenticatenales bacterium]